MLAHPNQPSSAPPDSYPLDGLVRTHWSLAVCVVCGHEQPRGEHSHASCRCGAQLRTFPLYRGLRAES
jgi:hypothetical protein